MLDEPFASLTKDFQIECEQIKYWCNALNDVKEQITAITQIIAKEATDNIRISKYGSNLINYFISNTQKFSNEPSNLYKLTFGFINILDLKNKYGLKTSGNMNNTLSNNTPPIVQNLEGFISNIISSSQLIMEEVIQLKTKSLEIRAKYAKSKELLNEAQVEKKKIEADPSTMYNDTVKGKATTRVLNAVQEMEAIRPELNKYSKKLEGKQEAFNTHMKDTFELVVMNVFKGIVYLHQFFFLISKNKLDDNIELKNIINDKINQGLRASNLSINDYAERKYAQSENIKYDPIHFNEQTLNNEMHNNNVVSLMNSYTTYTDIFIKCMRMRKKIIVVLLKFLMDLNRYELNNNNDNSTKAQNKIRDILKKAQHLGHSTRKTWVIFQTYWSNYKVFRTSFTTFVTSTAINVLTNFINDSKIDYNQFEAGWFKYERKIEQLRLSYVKVEEKHFNKRADGKANQKPKNHKGNNKALIEKENLIKTYLNTDCTEFLSKIIKQIREKDQKRLSDIANVIENLALLICKSIEETIEISKSEIENVTTIDMFEEIKEIFNKYFEKYKIANYEGYMESIKIKLLTKIDFDKDRLGQSTRESLSGYLSQNNITVSNSFVNDSFLSDMNNESIERLIAKNNNEGGNNNLESDSSEDNGSSIEKIEFVNKKNFNIIEGKDNPYQNFKEKEIKHYMRKLKDDSSNHPEMNKINKIDQIELMSDENYINKFSCQISSKSKGFLYVTDKKLIFSSNSNKQQFSIPIEDIISISKVNNPRHPCSIDVKTTKTSLNFRLFIDRDKCMECIYEQIDKMRKGSGDVGGGGGDNEAGKTMTKLGRQLVNRNIAINDLLKEIDFLGKLKAITQERMSMFEKEYADYAKEPFNFQPESAFEKCFINMNNVGNRGPLSLIFHFLLNPTIISEDLGKDKSFFESIYLLRGDIDMSLSYNEELYETIPKYYIDLDYSSGLFNNFKQSELEEFISDISSWPKTFSFELNFVHIIPPVMMKDRMNMKEIVTVYFISPTDLIVEHHSYASNFPFAETFISISQYRFHTEITFNQKDGMFKFVTSCKMHYVIKMIKSCFVESKIKAEGYKTYENEVKVNIFEKMKSVIETNSETYSEMSKKLFDEHIRRTINKYSSVLPEGYQDVDKDKNNENDAEMAKETGIDQNDANNPGADLNNRNGKTEIKKSNLIVYLLLGVVCMMIIIKFGFKHIGKDILKYISIDQIIKIIILAILGFLVFKIQKNKDNKLNQ